LIISVLGHIFVSALDEVVQLGRTQGTDLEIDPTKFDYIFDFYGVIKCLSVEPFECLIQGLSLSKYQPQSIIHVDIVLLIRILRRVQFIFVACCLGNRNERLMKPPERQCLWFEHESHEFLFLDKSLLIFLRQLISSIIVVPVCDMMNLAPAEDNYTR
jgi:hypothetical protein